MQNTSYFTCDSVCEKKKSFKNDGKETETDMEQKGHHNNDTGGRRERELKTQVAPTWRAVAQEIRFLFGFVTLEALVSSSVVFYMIVPRAFHFASLALTLPICLEQIIERRTLSPLYIGDRNRARLKVERYGET